MAAWLLAVPGAQARPVLVEMFVSQSCSSCPPANALLRQVAKRDKDILPLSLNVTYWNQLGWVDTDSRDALTARQYWYAGLQPGADVYTPEAVVDGRTQLVGSDAEALAAAIDAAKAAPAGDVAVDVTGGAQLAVRVAAGRGAGQIVMFGYDDLHATAVRGGENAGATITEINVVRSLAVLGTWHGQALQLAVKRPAGQHVAVLLQAADGAVLGLGTG